ncbi:unnamed protein product [Clonostachys rosea f. rosea IK726]|uniref:Acyl-coenzyme A diphosphatase SCS3 n=2 Tax=Bionectria ochroleuca TaxID=29856 RepID=A0A0B7K066_BIOOC|nr:unnamed protein product [Clonostachys rosea f. rosea IK726]
MPTTRRSAQKGATAGSATMANDSSSPPSTRISSSPATSRTPPFLPTFLERIVLGFFPILLVFGALFSVLSPQTRDAPYDPISQSHSQDPAVSPSYFARKSNLFNVIFVKRGWAWTTVAFAAFLLTHPSTSSPTRRLRGAARWGTVTLCWFFVTQWFFGAPIIDRGFRWTGGKCDVAELDVALGDSGVAEVVTAVACKAAGGKWRGGHDISGHVFMLVLSSVFLLEEVGWSLLRWTNWAPDERTVVMPDGAVKGAGVEAEIAADDNKGSGQLGFGIGGKFLMTVVGLNVWMLLMTAIYFHTWFEKFTGLLAAFIGWYIVYIVPRFVPAVRGLIGLPGI